MISIERQDQVTILKLNRKVTNPINLALVQSLDQALQEVKSDPDVRSMVLASANDKFFSIGFDIPELFPLPRQDFETFYREFNQVCLELYTLPKPTVASLTGHAIAGGCILALCCDYRLVAEGKKLIGLNEVKLGVPVPYLADRITHNLVGARYAREILELGEFYPPKQSLEVGLVDQILPLEQILPEAIAKASLLGAAPGDAFAQIKGNRVAIITEQVLTQWDDKQGIFVERWYSEEARACIRDSIERF